MSGLLNDNREWLFIHVPKTGGTSMGKIIGSIDHDPIWQFPTWFYRNKNTFAVVRHPHDRFISAATQQFYVNHNPPFNVLPHQPPFEKVKADVTRFIEDMHGSRVGAELNPQRIFQRINTRDMPRFLAWPYRVHFYPMWFFLTDHYRGMVMDHLMRYENLEEEWKELCHLADIRYKPLPHLRNAAITRRPAIEYYTEKTKKMVYDLYKTDFEMFGYEPW